MNRKKKFSFAFEIFLLIIGMIAGLVLLGVHAFNPFLHNYVVTGLLVLEAVCFAMLIAIAIIINKTRKQDYYDDEY